MQTKFCDLPFISCESHGTVGYKLQVDVSSFSCVLSPLPYEPADLVSWVDKVHLDHA